MKLALAQIDPTVGDLEGNRDLILANIEEARTAGADLVLLPELAVTGYPPEDLLLRPSFVRAARASLERIAAETRDLVAFVGVPLFDGELYNACAICADGEVTGWAKKRHLPNYGVFDEKRYFASSDELALIDVAGRESGSRSARTCGFPGRRRPSSPRRVRSSSSTSRPLRSISAERKSARPSSRRERQENDIRVALCNVVGGQDELSSTATRSSSESDGAVLARAPGFEETLFVVDLEQPESAGSRRWATTSSRCVARSSSACVTTSGRTASTPSW